MKKHKKRKSSNQTNREETTLSTIKELEPADEGQNSDNLPIALRKGKRNCVKPLPHDIALCLDHNKVSPVYKSFMTILNQEIIPKTAEEALMYPNWKKAMNEEMEALIKNNTWI